jgi:hypothetical protein
LAKKNEARKKYSTAKLKGRRKWTCQREIREKLPPKKGDE